MSRIGKKPIIIPEGVEIKIEGQKVIIKGPKGEVSQQISGDILVEKKDNKIILAPKTTSRNISALWGLSRALLQNCIKGVSDGFEKKLEITGVGYKANLEAGNILNLSVGFSHLVKMEIPDDLKVAIEKNIISVFGTDKQRVGEFAAKIRAIRPPEPYKGKGIRYFGEKVRRKEGKKAGATK